MHETTLVQLKATIILKNQYKEMKRIIPGLALAIMIALASCKKDNTGSTANTTTVQTVADELQAVAVAVSSKSSGDSVYIVHTCKANEKLTAIVFATIPAISTEYLNASYSGYSATQAYSITDSAGTVTGYIVVIQYNDNPVGIKFDATGTFVKVLEQREGHDLRDKGWHHGGRFDNRDGKHRDTLALGSLPAEVLSYLTTNYPQDTLLHAFITKDSNYVVISSNGSLYATVFTSSGTFVSRNALPVREGHTKAVATDSLPVTVTDYLTTTYPGYVLDKAYSLIKGDSIQGYIVIIDANNTKYALLFNADGGFVKVKVIQ